MGNVPLCSGGTHYKPPSKAQLRCPNILQCCQPPRLHASDGAWAWNYSIPTIHSRLMTVLSTIGSWQTEACIDEKGNSKCLNQLGKCLRVGLQGGLPYEKTLFCVAQVIERQVWLMIRAFQHWTISNLNQLPHKVGPGKKFTELRIQPYSIPNILS